MTITIVFIVSENLGSDADLNNKLNFAATVTSILLAAIAIVISLIEGFKNAKANENILNSSEVITGVTDQLSKSTQVLKSLSENLNNFDIAASLQSLQDKIENSNSELSSIKSMFANNSTSVQSATINTIFEDNKELTKNLIDSINSSKNNFLLKLLYFLANVSEINLENEKELTEVFTEVLNYDPDTNTFSETSRTPLISQFAVFSKLKFIDVWDAPHIINPQIIDILKEYPNEIYEPVDSYIKYKGLQKE
jgi:hypothetical protein